MSAPTARSPIRIALVDDYEVVLRGLADMFAAYPEIQVVELDVNEPVKAQVDIALYDTFAQAEADGPALDTLVASRHVQRVVIYTWAFAPDLVDLALTKGARGYLSKRLPASELVDALRRIAADEIVVSAEPARAHTTGTNDWPGRGEGLTERESEVIALITQGCSNRDIADLMYLSPNSIKSYIRTAYRKIGVTSRTQAVLWGLAHGFSIPGKNLDRWSDH